MNKIVKLTRDEYELAALDAVRRHIVATFDREVGAPEERDVIESGPSRFAVAKHYGIYQLSFSGDLLDGRVSARRCRDNVHLIVRPKDEKRAEDCALIAVTGSKGNYIIHGWQMLSWIIQNVHPTKIGLDQSRAPARITTQLRPPDELNPYIIEHLGALREVDNENF